MKSLSVDERKLLIIQGFVFLADALSSIFVTVFFFANSNFSNTVLYKLTIFASMTFFFALSGWALRRISSGALMKIGLAASALFYFLLFLLREQSVAFAIPLGILAGFSGGNYWAGFNLNQYILSHSGRRVSYFGWGGAIVNLANSVGPAIGGLVITFVGKSNLGIMNGYLTLFFLVAFIIAVAVLIIGKLPAHEFPQFSYRHIWDHKRSTLWKLVLGQQGIFGLYDVAIGTVAGILLFLILKNEALLGFALTAGSVFATIASLAAIPLLTKYPNSFWIGSAGSAVSIILFALFQTETGVWLFIIVSGLTSPFLGNKLSTVYFHTMDKEKGSWQEKYHLLLERDIVLGILRTLSFVGLFVLLQFGNEIQLAKAWLFILPILPLAIGFLLQKTLYSSS